MTVLVHNAGKGRWCTLRSAHPGGRIVTRCLDAWPYERACIATAAIPTDHQCPACRRELARDAREEVVEVGLVDLGGEAG